MILIAFLMLMADSGLLWRGRSGKLLILRFTLRGLRRGRLETTRSCRISSSTLLWSALLCRGGDSAEGRELAADNPHGMEEGESVRILIGLQRRLLHESADGEVSHHQPI
jgi:hypothetical protein